MKRLGLILAALLVFAVPSGAQPPDMCQGEPVTDARTTDLSDYLSGSDARDVAALGGGEDDQYFAALGPDVLCGNEGPDIIVGEAGADSITGNDGDDLLAGMGGADFVNGGLGADEIQGGGGDDELRAGGVDEARDHIYDGVGSDTIISVDPNDVWHRCEDGEPDPHEDFAGIIVPDNDCPG